MILPIYYNVDISQPLLPVPLNPMLVSQDALANRIGVRLFEGKTPYSPGGSCAGFAVRRDGATVPITGTISGNEMYIDLPAAAYALDGPINIGIKNVQGSAETTVFLGMGTVLRGETGTIIDPGTIIPSVSALIAQIENAVASIPADYSALLGSIAHIFSTSTAYTAGQYVWYEGELYRFNVAHPAGAWIGTDAARYTATDEFPLIQQALDTKANAAEVADLKSDVGMMSTAVEISSILDTSVNNYSYFIPSSSNKWTASTNGSSIFKIPDRAKLIRVKANQSAYAGTAFLTTNAHTANTAPDYATGWSAVDWISAGAEKTYEIPSDAEYVYIAKKYSSVTYTPEKVESIAFFDAKSAVETIASNTATAEAADAKAGQAINCLTIERSLDPASNTYSRFIPSSSNKWIASTNGSSIFAIPNGATKIRVKANQTKSAGTAFLKTNGRTENTTPDYATGWSAVDWISAGSEKVYEIPADAGYVYIAKTYNNVSYTPESVAAIKLFDAENIPNAQPPLGLHEMPADNNALNIVKRCRQMTDIKWTPAVDLPRFMLVQRGGVETPNTAQEQNYLGTFKAGVEYTGVPYGRVTETMTNYGYDFATVGHYIPFDTFISSICNPKSRLSVYDAGSVYGHRSVIYATVCSGMTCYALDVDEVPTASIANISGLTLIGKLNNNGTLLADSAIKIGDVLNLQGYHTGIITDIIRNADGTIQSVEISDASTAGLADRNYSDGQIGGLCRRKGWTKAQLFAAGSWGDYSVYRYTGTVTYTPSPYVNVGDEFDGWRIEHFPIMPYLGEGFAFKAGYIPNDAVRLVVTLDGYSYARVFKDGVEITGSPFTVTKDANDVIEPLSIMEIGAGSYTAYLCNMSNGDVTNLTYACHWTIE